MDHDFPAGAAVVRHRTKGLPDLGARSSTRGDRLCDSRVDATFVSANAVAVFFNPGALRGADGGWALHLRRSPLV